MYMLTVENSFASAHQLRGYKGKCENIHGHNWKVEVNIKGSKLNDIGLLIDFQDINKILKEIMTYLDHKNLNETAPFDTINPSSENIAKFIAEELNKGLNSFPGDIHTESVTVWESGTSRCTYYPE